MSGGDTVGSLLASIAESLDDGLRIFALADKSHWGPDEFEQMRALERALDDAKRDFQALCTLVKGQWYYESDRRPESLEELRILWAKFDFHAKNFKDWLRTGGPINPVWARETDGLRRELHAAQCRAARRIFAAQQDAGARCLGAYLVSRRLREMEATQRRQRQGGERDRLPQWSTGRGPGGAVLGPGGQAEPDEVRDCTQVNLEELVPICNSIGHFERFGERDIAFVCDFCDGFLVWEDLRSMPSSRPEPVTPDIAPVTTSTVAAASAPVPAPNTAPRWQARGTRISDGEVRDIAFAPLVIANHLVPEPREWRAGILCQLCDDSAEFYTQGQDELDELRYVQDEAGFPDVGAFQEHLESYHTPGSAILSISSVAGSCRVM